MISVTVLAVGGLSEKHWKEASDEYLKRLGAFCKAQVIEIPQARLPAKPSSAMIAQALEAEGKAILAKLPEKAAIISLCVEGGAESSEDLARRLTRYSGETSKIAFVIGGSHGLSERVKERSALRLSISAMTFPHQLARVMLLEQLYRAFTIEAGLLYHK